MNKKIIDQAIKAMGRAYTPYSKFNVGAAILLKDGTYILGSNVENASYGLSNCAERSAIFSLISQGYDPKDIVEMAIVGGQDIPISPCGACRQVLYEHLPENTKIYLTNLNYDVKEVTTSYLLPYGFKLEDE